MSLGVRIKQVRLAAKMTQAKLAEICGVSTQAVSGWERDIFAPDADTLNVISRALGCDLQWLISGITFTNKPPNGSGNGHWRGRVVSSVQWPDIAHFLSGSFQSKETARSHFECGPRSFQTFISDRSNEPTLSAGDSIVVDPDVTPEPGDLVLAWHQSAPVLRRYRPRDGHFELAPINPDWPTITISNGLDDAIIGVVTETSRPRRR